MKTSQVYVKDFIKKMLHTLNYPSMEDKQLIIPWLVVGKFSKLSKIKLAPRLK